MNDVSQKTNSIQYLINFRKLSVSLPVTFSGLNQVHDGFSSSGGQTKLELTFWFFFYSNVFGIASFARINLFADIKKGLGMQERMVMWCVCAKSPPDFWFGRMSTCKFENSISIKKSRRGNFYAQISLFEPLIWARNEDDHFNHGRRQLRRPRPALSSGQTGERDRAHRDVFVLKVNSENRIWREKMFQVNQSLFS